MVNNLITGMMPKANPQNVVNQPRENTETIAYLVPDTANEEGALGK